MEKARAKDYWRVDDYDNKDDLQAAIGNVCLNI